MYYVKVSATAAALVLQAVPQAYGYDSSLTTHSSLAMESKKSYNANLKYMEDRQQGLQCSGMLLFEAEKPIPAKKKDFKKNCPPPKEIQEGLITFENLPKGIQDTIKEEKIKMELAKEEEDFWKKNNEEMKAFMEEMKALKDPNAQNVTPNQWSFESFH